MLIGLNTTTKGIGGIQQNIQAIEYHDGPGMKILTENWLYSMEKE